MQEQCLEADVVVAGGGLAGVCASLAAARNGATVVLIQDRPVLGGNTSSEISVHAGGADFDGHRPHARESGIIEELRLEDAVRDSRCVPVMWDLILYDAIRREPRITLLLNTSVVGVKMAAPGRIAQVEAIRPSTQHAFSVAGSMFLDCTGDGWLGFFAGADYRMGREAPEEYGEPHALGPDNLTLGASLCFIARDVGEPVDFIPPPWARRFLSCDALPHRHPDLCRHGFWWNELGGVFDMTRDTERVRDELVATLLGLWDHIKNHCPRCREEARTWDLEWFGWVPGKRETRRLMGDHVLTELDLIEARPFHDAVAHGGWPIDLHPPWGIYDPAPPALMLPLEDIYSIPLRSLYSRNLENLLFAGRCASATHVAFGSTRLAATGAAMGQAAGTAAALAVRRNCTPREVADRHIRELQEILLRQDQYIPDVAAQDEKDLARKPAIRASSEAPESEAANVANGITRYTRGSTNQWASREGEALPHWIELKWPQNQSVSEIHLTFDTGFARPLTHSQYPSTVGKQVRGPQPETVKDFRIEAWLDGAWRPLARITDNYQRKRVLKLARPVTTSGLRVVVEATQGDTQARIYEVRAYS
ncbi:MAG: FAD-dependent oxidoreductase [Armatimonadetes bacterium]|nr:FAD-dependent oxidoreductase [Armatimonadota bacterium]